MTAKTTPNLILYRGFDSPNRHVWSPFVNKLEARLRIAGLQYAVAPGSMREAPRGKIPYLAVQDQDGTELIDDTTLITRRLIDRGIITDINANLPPTQKTLDLSVRALFEDKLSFYQTRERWVDNYRTMREGSLAGLPYAARLIVGLLASRIMNRTLHGQGTGRFTAEEAREFRIEIWESLNAMLADARGSAASVAALNEDADAPFWVLGRVEPTDADATVFGFLAAGLVCDAAPETKNIIRRFPILVDYAKRIHDRYFADYEIWEHVGL